MNPFTRDLAKELCDLPRRSLLSHIAKIRLIFYEGHPGREYKPFEKFLDPVEKAQFDKEVNRYVRLPRHF